MAKKDKTFTSGDIVRIWCNHLTAKEQIDIFLFFFFIFPGIALDNETLRDIFDEVKKRIPNFAFKLIMRFSFAYLKVIRRVFNKAMANIIFDSSAREEVIECILKRTKD